MSNSGLYGNVSNVTVTSNNVTTLYNARASSVSTGNVAGRNFTTLYTNQAEINPTTPYGNSNVQAFLNLGEDIGGNQVQNITTHGNITVGGNSYLGNVSNVIIGGGNTGYVLTTNGEGNLIWAEPHISGTTTPYIHFDVSSTGNNQQFTNTLIGQYSSNTMMNVFKNGVNIEPFYYELVNPTTLQINILLNSGDTIDVLAEGAGGGGTPGGIVGSVQYNDGYISTGASDFLYTPANGTSSSSVTLPNTTVNGTMSISGVVSINTVNANIANVNTVNANTVNANIANVTQLNMSSISGLDVPGGTSGQAILTDGSGHLSWGNITQTPGGSDTDIQYNKSGVLYGDSSLTYDYTNTRISTANLDLISLGISNPSTPAGLRFGDSGNGSQIEGLVSFAPSSPGFNGFMGIKSYTGNIVLVANSASGSSSKFWEFLTSGNILFPDTTQQNTAWTGNVSVANVTGLGNIATINLDSSSSNVLYGNGAWASIPATANSNYANFAGNVVIASQPNITSVGTLITLGVSGMANLHQAKEYFASNSTAATGYVNFDVSNSSIVLQTASATNNFILNVRGNSSTTFDSITNTGDSVSITYVNLNSGTAYYLLGIEIDGTTVSPRWYNATPPTSGTVGGYDVYNFNILKTAANSYVVFGLTGGYK